jgi:hypothetical protein
MLRILSSVIVVSISILCGNGRKVMVMALSGDALMRSVITARRGGWEMHVELRIKHFISFWRLDSSSRGVGAAEIMTPFDEIDASAICAALRPIREGRVVHAKRPASRRGGWCDDRLQAKGPSARGPEWITFVAFISNNTTA